MDTVRHSGITIFALLLVTFLLSIISDTLRASQQSVAKTESVSHGQATSSAVMAKMPEISLLNVVDNNGQDERGYGVPLQIMLLMTGLSFIPGMLMVMTCFTRIVVVFSLLRQALGLQQTPPNPVVIGLALFLTFFIMTPVFEQIDEVALQPWIRDELTFQEAIAAGVKPLKKFMLYQTRESDLKRMSDISGIDPGENLEEIPLQLLAPAYIISELKTAFQIGFLLFIPFLVIDMVVASVLMAMGMMMLSPLVISLPFKLMLFVLVDGWSMITGTLAASFY